MIRNGIYYSTKFIQGLVITSMLMLSNCNRGAVDTRPAFSLIPWPVKSVLLSDSFLFKEKTTIIINGDPDEKKMALLLKGFLSRCIGSGYDITEEASGSKGIHLSINKHEDAETGDEGYRLRVSKDDIFINANKGAGLFYGIQTLLQLIPGSGGVKTSKGPVQVKIPGVDITDYPRFKWRGLMLDVSRHFFSVSEIKRLISEMAAYKFNVLHLHLTDDNGWRIEIKSLPELTKTGALRVSRSGWWGVRQPPGENERADYGGYYTQADIRELVSYADSMAISILPEIDIPGHSLAAIASYNNLSCTKLKYQVNPGSKFYGVDDNALCAGNDSTYVFLEKVFDEIAVLFPSTYIHVGGDECYRGFWENCPVCKNTMKNNHLSNSAELQNYFFKKVDKILSARGKKMIGWDETLEGEDIPGVTGMIWRGNGPAQKAVRNNHNVIMASKDYTYLDYYQSDPAVEKPSFSMLRLKKTYQFEPVPQAVNSRYIIGGQGNLWSEFVPDFVHAEYMLWPRSFALAEILWSPDGQRNWQNFIFRVQQNLERFKYAGINHSLGFYDAIVNVSKNKDGRIEISLDTELDSLKIYYTFSQTDPDQGSLQYIKGQRLVLPPGAVFFRVVTYENNHQAGKVIVLPLYELQRRTEEQNKTGGL